ncbi:MAG: hypothetical protein IJC51_03355, partial [Eggerthellaceae bacterium]|nr:hypothetical protein [Eggerthellaceae bacterium]
QVWEHPHVSAGVEMAGWEGAFILRMASEQVFYGAEEDRPPRFGSASTAVRFKDACKRSQSEGFWPEEAFSAENCSQT